MSKKICDRIEKEIIIKYLNKNRICILSREYGIHSATIRNILKRNNIEYLEEFKTPRKYYVNSDYFIKIDDEYKAYFLGLLYADGYIATNKNFGAFELCLSGDDELELLKVFVNKIEYTGKIILKKKIKEKFKQPYRVCIKDKKFCQNLCEKGCIPQKSLILKFPTEEQVPNDMLRHFIRGYLDGDGCISFKKDKQLLVGLVSTNSFIEELNKYLTKNINVKFGVYKPKNKKIMESKIGGLKAIKFLNFIYKDSSVFLNRKKEVFDKFLQFYQEKFKDESSLWNLSVNSKKYINEIFNTKCIENYRFMITREQKRNIIELYKLQLSVRNIGRKLNLDHGSVRRYLKSIGLETNKERLFSVNDYNYSQAADKILKEMEIN